MVVLSTSSSSSRTVLFVSLMTRLYMFFLAIVVITILTQVRLHRFVQDTALLGERTSRPRTSKVPGEQRCAINLFGLPRAFQSLVLPSLLKNVIQTNQQYNCDYFVHYYFLQEEVGGRSGSGGKIDPNEIKQLEQAVRQVAANSGNSKKRTPTVAFAFDTEQQFWKEYTPLTEKIRNTKDPEGNYLYFPYKAVTYKYPTTTDNIVKMWHSIQRSYRLMEQYEKKLNVKYTRVAMLRSDVVYVTPVDMYFVNQTLPKDTDNRVAVIPGFGKHPVSDRLIYGPREAVHIWATQRFPRLDEHVQMIYNSTQHHGFGMHSERFVGLTLLPLIQQTTDVTIYEHDTLCFFRARPDETVWVKDCHSASTHSIQSNMQHPREVLRQILGRPCSEPEKLTRSFSFVNCSKAWALEH